MKKNLQLLASFVGGNFFLCFACRSGKRYSLFLLSSLLFRLIFVLLIFICIASCESDSTPPIDNRDKLEKKKSSQKSKKQLEVNKPVIYQAFIKGPITPSAKEALNNAIAKAEEENAQALLVQLDTPGGLASSMDDMIRRILNASVPIITYVSPPGATCGSAGVYIIYASHVAAMAPATNIGSATPVSIGGGGSPAGKGGGADKEGAKPANDRIPKTAGADDGLNMKRKVLNHARAQIRSLAQYHKRNIRFAESTVTRAVNLSSQEAYKHKAVDVLANDVHDLLRKIEGRKVRMTGGYIKLKLKEARIIPIHKDYRQKILDLLANPNLAYIFMMLGILGLLAEVQNPGMIFPGIIGGISLLLGLYAMQTLSLNYTALGLIGFSCILFLLEVYVISYGLLSFAGVICMMLGSIMLARSGAEFSSFSLSLVVTVGIASSLFCAFMAYVGVKSQGAKRLTTYERLMREPVVSHTVITTHDGMVKVHSELWQARCLPNNEEIPAGTPVRIVNNQGLTLIVEMHNKQIQ